eukprot:scaffold5035_cov228-Skeletonema_menzelii.AAC.1
MGEGICRTAVTWHKDACHGECARCRGITLDITSSSSVLRSLLTDCSANNANALLENQPAPYYH